MNFLQALLTAPTFENEEHNRQASLLHKVILGAWVVPIVLIANLILLPTNRELIIPVLLTTLVVLTIVSILARRGNTRGASVLLITIIVAIGLYINYIAAGDPRPVIIFFGWMCVVGGLLLGYRGALFVAFIFASEQVILTLLRSSNLIQPLSDPPTALSGSITYIFGYFLIAITFGLASNSIQESLAQAKNNEQKLFMSNQNLEELARDLENRVHERTAEIEALAQRADKRAQQLQAIAETSKEISSIQELDQILPLIANSISDRFGYYHVGIFLLDAKKEFAVLVASNSSGGKKMLKRNHKIPVGIRGIVGRVAETGQPRIAMLVKDDRAFITNPDLPETRSEMALALKVADHVVGVLDVQSKEENAFSNEDASILGVLANQVAVAIENSRLFTSTNETLKTSQKIYQQYVEQEWQQYIERTDLVGYRLSSTGVNIIRKNDPTPSTENPTTIPIIASGQIIGTLEIQSKNKDSRLTTDESALLQATAERIALALDNVRLLQAAQIQASKEKSISNLSSKIGAAVNIDGILETAAQEIGSLLPGSEITIQISQNKG